MAKLTKFTLSPSGELVYKSTGKLAPSNYIFRKNTVYKLGSDGVRRRVGSLSRKLTKTEATRIARAERSRNVRHQRQVKKILGVKGKLKQTPFGPMPDDGKPSKPRSPSANAKSLRYEEWEDITDTEFPEADELVMEEFAQRVRDAALSVAPPWLQDRIRALSTAALWKAYMQDAYIFEIYFKYHNPVDAPHKSDISIWLYQFVLRIEQYMGVRS